MGLLHKIKTFLLSNLHVFVLLNILAVIIVINFHAGSFLLTNDNYSPELNPSLTIARSVNSPAWRGYRALGLPSDSEQSDVFRAVLYSAIDEVVPVSAAAQVYVFLCMSVGVLAFTFLVSNIVRDYLPKFSSSAVGFVGGIFYLTTLWTAWVFVFPLMPYVAQFGFLPLVLLACYKYIRSASPVHALFVVVAGLFLATSALIATVFFVEMVAIVAFIFVFSLRRVNFRSVVLRFLSTLLLFIGSQFFWLFPFMYYLKSASSDVINSSINKSITPSTIESEKLNMTAENSLRFYTSYLYTKDDNTGDVRLFEPAETYLSDGAIWTLSFVPAALAGIGLVFILIKRAWKLLVFWLLGIGTWYFIKNLNPPFPDLFVWLQNGSILFLEALRWPTSKFGGVFLVTLAFGAAVGTGGVIYLLTYFFKGWLKAGVTAILALAVCGVQLFFLGYVFDGQLFADRDFAKLPSSYYDMAAYLDETAPTARVVEFPPPNTGYFREQSWGFIGSGFFHYLSQNPFLEVNLAIGSLDSEAATAAINRKYAEADAAGLLAELNRYDVEYVFVDRSTVPGRYGAEIDWSLIDKNVGNYSVVWTEDELTLYAVPDIYGIGETTYVEVLDNNASGIMAGKLLEFNYAASPMISPFTLEYEDPEIVGNYIQGEYVYAGRSQYFTENLSDIDLSSAPTKVQGVDGYFVVTPSLPIFDGLEHTLPYRRFNDVGYDYVIAAQNVISVSDAANGGVTVSDGYGSVGSLGGVKSGYLSGVGLLPTLSQDVAADCSLNSGNAVASSFENGLLSLSSTDGTACLDVPITITQPTMARVVMGWQAEPGTMVGFCVWSSNAGECVNSDRFFDTGGGSDSIDVDLPVLLNAWDQYTFYLYVVSKDKTRHEASFENVSVYLSGQIDPLYPVSVSDKAGGGGMYVENGQELSVKIPIVRGPAAYQYPDLNDVLWDYWPKECLPTEDDEAIEEIDELWANIPKEYSTWADEYGLHQSAMACGFPQASEVVRTAKDKNYIWYWNGSNEAGTPASLCLLYEYSSRCQSSDGPLMNSEMSGLRYFRSSVEKSQLSLYMRTRSVSLESLNTLLEFVLQPMPDQWSKYAMVPDSVNVYTEQRVNLDTGLDRVGSVVYYAPIPTKENTVLSISQNYSDGWTAYAIKDTDFLRNLPEPLKYLAYPLVGYKISDVNKAELDGWKQGWVVSPLLANSGYDQVVILFSPNMFSYVGFMVTVSMVVTMLALSVFEVKLMLQRKSARKIRRKK